MFEAVFLIVGCAALLLYALYESDKANQRDLDRARQREARQIARINLLSDELNNYIKGLNDEYVYFDKIKARIIALNERVELRDDRVENDLKDFVKDIKLSNYCLLAQHPDRITPDKFEVALPDGHFDDQQVIGLLGNEYTVNLGNRDCSCEYMRTARKEFGLNDVRRVCRHQVQLLKASHPNVLSEASPLVRQILGQVYRDQFYGCLHGKSFTALIRYSLPLEWVGIESMTFGDYSYNVLEKRWSGGDSPSGYAIEVKSLLIRYFRLDAYRNS